jgi:hypothetical protein
MNKLLTLLFMFSAYGGELEYFDSKINYWNKSVKI